MQVSEIIPCANMMITLTLYMIYFEFSEEQAKSLGLYLVIETNMKSTWIFYISINWGKFENYPLGYETLYFFVQKYCFFSV